MPFIQFVGASREDADNPQDNPSRLVNFFRERTGGRGEYTLKGVPGMVAFATTERVFVRAMAVVEGVLYAAMQGYLVKIESDGTVTELGSIVNSEDTSISSNNGDVVVAAGGTYYVWDGSTLSTPTGAQFSSIGSVTFLGQRTVMTERNGRRVQWSVVADASDISGAGSGFATAEIKDDKCLRAIAVGADVLWIFKEGSIERWATSSGDDVFTPILGAGLDVGLKGYRLVTSFPSGIFWVGEDNVCYISGGMGGARPVSTPAVETEIKYGTPRSCFYYEDEGHKFCVIRFNDAPAWVFDISMGEWHERSEGAAYGQWTAVAAAEAYGYHIVGCDDGDYYVLSRQGTDKGAPLICEATSQVLEIDGERFRVPEVQLYPQVGRTSIGLDQGAYVGTAEGQLLLDGEGNLLAAYAESTPRDGYITLETSKDAGETWGSPIQLSIGNLGDYGKTVKARNLGQFTSLTARVTYAEPDDTPIQARAKVVVAPDMRAWA